MLLIVRMRKGSVSILIFIVLSAENTFHINELIGKDLFILPLFLLFSLKIVYSLLVSRLLFIG